MKYIRKRGVENAGGAALNWNVGVPLESDIWEVADPPLIYVTEFPTALHGKA